MNNKMTTNSQLSTNECKKKRRKTMKTKTKQKARTGTESENGHHRVGFQWGEEGEE